jgi:hypothetical protein
MQNLSLSREEALERCQHGGTVLCLDVPQGVEFGIDLRSYTVGPRFRGVKMVPPHGVHMITCGNEIEQTGVFVSLRPSETCAMSWDAPTETLKLMDDAAMREQLTHAVQRMELDAFLGPYPLVPGNRMALANRPLAVLVAAAVAAPEEEEPATTAPEEEEPTTTGASAAARIEGSRPLTADEARAAAAAEGLALVPASASNCDAVAELLALHDGINELDEEAEEHLPRLIDYQFTAQMEEDLDAISRGEGEKLAYLKKFPIDALKIDRTFVRDIVEDPDDAAITAAVIAIGHHMQLRVVAEGVETPEQLAILRAMACDEYQGYLFSRPVPADAFAARFLVPDAHAGAASAGTGAEEGPGAGTAGEGAGIVACAGRGTGAGAAAAAAPAVSARAPASPGPALPG